jgi:hypothetical protein
VAFPVTRLPLWFKIVFTVWFVAWVPAYVAFYGPKNFLWLCDLCNFILLIALWTESRLLFSSQLVAVFLLDILWSVDVGMAFLLGIHPIGGTEYMFNPAIPIHIRLFSLFHVFTPPLLIWGVWRLGFHRRGLLLQAVLTWVVLPVSWLVSSPEWNINWVWGLFGKPQTLVHPWVYLFLCMVFYPVIVYLPTHLLSLLVFRTVRGR